MCSARHINQGFVESRGEKNHVSEEQAHAALIQPVERRCATQGAHTFVVVVRPDVLQRHHQREARSRHRRRWPASAIETWGKHDREGRAVHNLAPEYSMYTEFRHGLEWAG
jgi:hypothetical protein